MAKKAIPLAAVTLAFAAAVTVPAEQAHAAGKEKMLRRRPRRSKRLCRWTWHVLCRQLNHRLPRQRLETGARWNLRNHGVQDLRYRIRKADGIQGSMMDKKG